MDSLPKSKEKKKMIKEKIKDFGLIYLIAIIALLLAISSCNINKTSTSITGFAVKEKDSNDNKNTAVNETTTQTTNETQTITNETTKEETPKEEKEKPEKAKEPNKPPVWKSEVSEFVLKGKTVIDLSNYFYDENNDSLAYLFTTPDKIKVDIDNSVVTLTPIGHNFTATISFTATDGEKATTKEITLIVPEKKITINLEYKQGTDYDKDNDGYEPTTGIIDLTVENSSFSWYADESKLCTKWNVYSIEEGKTTTVCYGSSKCCNFIGLEPTREKWNEVFYSAYGQYGATLNNVVSAQIIYADYELSVNEPFAEIYYSDLKELAAKYYFAFIDFKNVCVDTCSLSGFNDTSYKLIFEIDNAVLNLDTLTYSIAEEVSKVLVNLAVKDDKGTTSGSYQLYKNNAIVPVTENVVEPDYYDIEVTPTANVIDKLLIENANITKPLTANIGIDNVTREIIIENVDVKKTYAVDLKELEFEKATLTATATANALYKCKQWDYNNEVCFGAWEKIKYLVPGQQYELTLTKDDPGFIEGDVNITILPVNITGLALIKDIPNITVIINENATIDLSNYFSNIDGAIFTYFEQDGISILFDNNIATIIPNENFTGTVYTYITANQSSNLAVSNVFSITITNVTANATLTPNLILKKKDFKLDEDIDLDFEYLTKQELVKENKWKEEYEVYEKKTEKTKEELELLKQRIVKKEKQKKKWQAINETIETFVYDNNRNLVTVEPEIEELRDGKFKLKLPKSRAFKAGKYTLKLDLVKDGVTYTQEQDFTWGVLAINVNKSIYLPNEDSFIGIGVLDDRGKVVCNADVTLEITNPLNEKTILSTTNNQIKISPECTKLGVTELPDYYTTYNVDGVGAYVMNLTAVTANGIRNILDNFTVQSSVAFDVARKGPTRVYPPVPYKMNFTINANDDYSGPVIEYVPSSFAVTSQQDIIVNEIGDAKLITWILDLVKGRTYNLGYEFDAPDVSPEFYVLGPLEIGNFKEARQWQIANDVPLTLNVTVRGMLVYGEEGIPTARYRIWNGTNFTYEQDSGVVTGPINWTVVKASNKGQEFISVMTNSSGALLMMVYNGSCWGNATSCNGKFVLLDGSAGKQINNSLRAFDVAYENLSGRDDQLAIIVYSNTSNYPLYTIWNSTDKNISSMKNINYSNINVTSTVGWIDLIEMGSNSGANEIALLMRSESNERLSAIIWNATNTTWGCNTTLSTSLEAATEFKDFGGAYQKNNQNLFVATSETTANIRYANKTLNQCNWKVSGTIPVQEIAAIMDVGGDDVKGNTTCLATQDFTAQDNVNYIYKGDGTFSVPSPNDITSVVSPVAPSQVVACGGAGNYTIAIYVDSASIQLDYYRFPNSTNNWTPSYTATAIGDRFVPNPAIGTRNNIIVRQFPEDPAVTNRTFVFYSDSFQDLNVVIFDSAKVNFSASYSNILGGNKIEETVSSPGTLSFDFALLYSSRFIFLGVSSVLMALCRWG